MRSFKLLAAAALLLAACTPKAQIDCTVAQAPRSEVSVRLLDMNVFSELIDVLGGVDIYVESDMNYDDQEAGNKV